MKTKTRGPISFTAMEDDGIEGLILPSLFLGAILRTEIRFMAFGYSQEEMALAEVKVGLSLMKDGQFIFEHQFAGYSCRTQVLLGIFLPLDSCDNPDIRDRLLRFTSEFHPLDPSRALLLWEKWHGVFEDIGPLESTREEVAEAFMRFDARRAYPWMRQHFRYVVEFSGMSSEDLRYEFSKIPPLKNIDPNRPDTKEWAGTMTERDFDRFRSVQDLSGASRKISRQESMPWQGLEEFAEWLSRGDQFRVGPEEICAGLIYENSD